MKNQKKLLIGLFAVLIFSNIIFAYLLFFNNSNPEKGNFGGVEGNFNGGMPNMELTDEEISDVTSFFQSTTDSEEIESYCQSNSMYCMYYCMNVDSTSEACNQLQPSGPQNN